MHKDANKKHYNVGLCTFNYGITNLKISDLGKENSSRLIPANINHSLMQTIIFNITNKTCKVLNQCSLGQGSSSPMVQRRTVERQEEGRKYLGGEVGEP